ncbi:hypothetical protein K4K56_006518 [Colletotrichum sp. SAR 10_98]|nr:hypothetical protein K4K56_006518 [Colletotrichum sp. SAR 10_98]
MVAMPATVATRSTQQEQNIEKQLLEDSSVHEDSNESNGMTGLLSSNIHGLCELPEGYHLMQVPRKATFAGEDDLPVDHRPCYNLVRVLASIIQLIFAISTLYRTRGDQIERYGYAAFGLTVIPYAWMSLINLVGNAICPQYDKIYVVSSRALRDLQLARKEGSQDSQTQDQTQWRVDGTVGRLEDHWDEQLCKAFEYCREHEGAEQTGRTRPLLYTVFATWNRKSPSRMILGPFIDLLNPFRHWKDWVEDTRRARRWWKDEVVRVAREIRQDPKSGMFSFYHRWKEQLLAPLIVFVVPLAIVGGLSGFQPGQSEPFQRAENHGAANRHRVYGVKMALAARKAASLKPEIRLAQAVSEFEAGLDSEHKASFRNMRFATTAAPPTLSDVMKLTAEVDSRQFAALGDTVVGGSQNLVACGIWSAVRMMLQVSCLPTQSTSLS